MRILATLYNEIARNCLGLASVKCTVQDLNKGQSIPEKTESTWFVAERFKLSVFDGEVTGFGRGRLRRSC